MDAVGLELDRRSRSSRIWAARDRREVLSFGLYGLPFLVVAGIYEVLGSVFAAHSEIHVGDLYALEEMLFSVQTATGTRALSEVIAQATHPVLDVICGVTYLTFLPEVVGVAIYLFFRDRPKMLQISLGFLIANLLGWVVWSVYPAAPPWYVDLYGTGPALLDAPASSAGLSRFDALVGLPIADIFYSKSANVFGAMPSLHVAYAVLVAFVSWPLRGYLRIFTLLFAASIVFSAVYLRHHYLLDVVAGGVIAVLTWCLGRLVLRGRDEECA